MLRGAAAFVVNRTVGGYCMVCLGTQHVALTRMYSYHASLYSMRGSGKRSSISHIFHRGAEDPSPQAGSGKLVLFFISNRVVGQVLLGGIILAFRHEFHGLRVARVGTRFGNPLYIQRV